MLVLLSFLLSIRVPFLAVFVCLSVFKTEISLAAGAWFGQTFGRVFGGVSGRVIIHGET